MPPLPTTNPTEPITEPLSAEAALASLPILFHAGYQTTDVPGQLRMHHSNDWRVRLVLSLVTVVALPFLLWLLLTNGEHFGVVFVGSLLVMLFCVVNTRTDVLIDPSARTVTRKKSFVFSIPMGTRTWRVRPSMELKAFVHGDGERYTDHDIALVDGRHRLALTPPHYSSAEASLEIIKLGNALAQLLGVPFTGYARKWRFYWP